MTQETHPNDTAIQALLAEKLDRAIETAGHQALGEGVSLTTFLTALFAEAPPEWIEAIEADALLAAASSLSGWGAKRSPNSARVRVFDPSQEEHGWAPGRTVIEIVNDDMPFLVDSTTNALTRLGVEIVALLHPIFQVDRDSEGRVESLESSGNVDARRESWMQIHVRRQAKGRHEEIRSTIEGVLSDVRCAVEDWGSMRALCQERIEKLENHPPPLDEEEVAEGVEFLRWLDDNYFTFLGTREYRFDGEGESAIGRIVPGSSFGILRDDNVSVFDGLRNLGRLPQDIRQFIRERSLLRVTKANSISTVHRAANLDAISVKTFDREGKVVGERLFVGLFTSGAYAANVLDVPLIRRKVRTVLASCGFQPESHNGRALLHVLEIHPRDELFQLSSDELCDTGRRVLEIQGGLQIALITRIDRFERFVSCLIYVPRDRFETKLRKRFQRILEQAFDGRVTTYYTLLTDEPLARLHVILKTRPGEIPRVDHDELEKRLRKAGDSWHLLLERALIATHGEEEGLAKSRRFSEVWSAGYREYYEPEAAVDDVDALEELIDGAQILDHDEVLRVAQGRDGRADSLLIKFFTLRQMIPLWLVLQRLEHMGLEVSMESHFDLELSSGDVLWIREIEARVEGDQSIDLQKVGQPFLEALRQIWDSKVESDGFNRLVLAAGLAAREVWVIRAYTRYLNQTRTPFGAEYMKSLLARRGDITRRLVDLFLVRFDPERENDRERAASELGREIRSELDRVESLDEDRVFRLFLNLIESTVRTNFFHRGADGRAKDYLALKLDSRRLLDLPSPRPWREIWVHGPELEGIHLRGGPVARGGLRWSDRPEDFRTEVLGLMKAQMVKNAVIVPEGSKGGFVVRNPSSDRERLKGQVSSVYQTFIRALLDLTDNLIGSEVVAPTRTVCWDDRDPYLVVAADKGTATFSDLANAVSVEYGYWLGDAFASGGSAGYDHKKMGITARGTWESVKRHFRELGRNVEEEEITVVGIGDMAGDVFGNGMLMSTHLRLVAAFNHREIFLDPEPDAERTFGERQRLFDLPGSSWSDFDCSVLSSGGAAHSRSRKSIELSPEMRQRLGVEEDALEPNELIKAILRAEVDLIWFGGIGTYVKGSAESHLDVGDRVNDALRVDSSEIRARVIAEGANLGLTQCGRVECSLRGVRLNTDFIDNSAGVDCSDHEVNLKILLGAARENGRLEGVNRDELLRSQTEDVAELVLRDNYLQSQAITVTEFLGERLSGRLTRTMTTLEKKGLLDRRIEFLPSDEDIEERRRKGQSFTRPELAVLLCYVKNDLFRALMGADGVEDSVLVPDLMAYFPHALKNGFPEDIRRHRLAKEIVATSLANEIVNRAGITFTYEVARRSGRSHDEVAMAFVATREILELPSLWRDIEALDNEVPAALQARLLVECGRLTERCCLALLRRSRSGVGVRDWIALYRDGFVNLRAQLAQLVSSEMRSALNRSIEEEVARGVPEMLSYRLVVTRRVASAFDIVDLSSERGRALDWAAAVYFAIEERFGFDRLRAAARGVEGEGAWMRLALGSIIDELFQLQARLTDRVLSLSGEDETTDPRQLLERFLSEHANAVNDVDELLVEVSRQSVDVALLTVATQSLKGLIGFDEP